MIGINQLRCETAHSPHRSISSLDSASMASSLGTVLYDRAT
jgi:hypothetical protein